MKDIVNKTIYDTVAWLEKETTEYTMFLVKEKDRFIIDNIKNKINAYETVKDDLLLLLFKRKHNLV